MKQMISADDLLLEVSPETPCGDALEYDPDFVAMEKAARGKEAQQMGDSVIPAEEPDWPTVKSKALDLFKRTKDLRVAVYLTRAVVPIDGLVGLHDGLKVVDGLLERYWDDLHPRLDPEDNNDPTLRVNTLLNLCGAETMLRPIREAELVSTKGIGRFTARDYLVAEGKLPWPQSSDAPPPEISDIDDAFMGCDLEKLQEKAEAVKESIGLIESIESILTDKVGSSQTVGFTPITDLLKDLDRILSAQLVRRGVGDPEALAGGAPSTAVTGEIKSREDVMRILEKVCDYFQRNEPSSPVPLLLKRATRLLSKDFMEIVRDLAPSGAQEVEKLRGPEGE